jgi:hypothetical protein
VKKYEGPERRKTIKVVEAPGDDGH